MDPMVCGLRDQTWLCVYCWCETPEGVVSPCWVITRAQSEWMPHGETTHEGVWHQQYTHNHVWSRLEHDAIIFSTATNILLIKSNLKFESRATAVYVAMSPRYLGGKYPSCLHPWSRKCTCLFLREAEHVKSIWNPWWTGICNVKWFHDKHLQKIQGPIPL